MDYTVYEKETMSFSKYLSKCFLWMFLGLLVSFGAAAFFTYTGLFLNIFVNTGMSFIIICSIIEIVLVISLVRSISKLNYNSAVSMFVIYSLINGITLSSIFYIYELSSIIYVFLGSAAVFGIMSMVGYTTKLDLSKLSVFIPIALISMLVVGLILMISFSSVLYLIYSLIGIGLFMIITTYDVFVIKNMYYNATTANEQNTLAIYGALQLYLDFINIFLHLLALFARNRD